MTRILIHQAAYDRLKPQLDALGPKAEIMTMTSDGTIWRDGVEVSPEAANLEAAWVNTDFFQTPAIGALFGAVMKSTALVWVQSAAAGYENPMFARIVEKGARLTTNHSQSVGISEYVLWGVLNHFQRGPERALEQKAHQWTILPFREISGTRWLVVGFGAIGQDIAKRARAFGAHVTGVRRSAGDQAHADAMITPDQIAAHLGDSDVVVMSIPLSPATADMVDARFLAAMRPNSMFVNVGRGGLVDEDALLAALDAGKPEHALLDVFRTEPLPADSRFWDHPRVTMTPHASPVGSGLGARGDALFVENLTRFLAGQPLLNEVSREEVLAGAAPGQVNPRTA
jgi:phosphoglycerate dehydrogenase-like enzyme